MSNSDTTTESTKSNRSSPVFPLIVTGMHRSGTSLMASFFQAVGVDVGTDLFAADERNQRGYFEDVDFLEFQRSILQECCNPSEHGWADWGWTESEHLDLSLDPVKLTRSIAEARNILKSRSECHAIWGWKDPRTSLLLDFWHQLLPDARYILVYRFPWDVADSVLRLHSPIFSQYPDYAVRIWAFYNRHLLKFYNAHPDRCILVSVNGFLQQPDRLINLLQTKFNLPILGSDAAQQVAQIYDPRLFGSLDRQHPTVQLLCQIYPESLALLAQFDRVADLPSDFPHDVPVPETNDSANYLAIRAALSLHYRLLQAESEPKLESIDRSSDRISNPKSDAETAALESQITHLAAEIAAIKTSKFWKIRTAWFALKRILSQSSELH